MSFPPVDQATLINLTPNLDVGKIADPALRLQAFQYLYGKLSEIINKLNSSISSQSGSENIGSSVVAGLSGLTIYAQIAEIEAQIQSIQGGVVPSGSISSTMIQNLAITTAKLALLAVGTGQLADGAVTFTKHDDETQTDLIGGQTYSYKNFGGF